MIPHMQKGDLMALPPSRQRKICGCQERCQEFITFVGAEEDFILCKGDATQFGFELLEILGLVTKAQAFPQSKYGWTTEQERFIKNYLKSGGCMDDEGKVKFGTYTLLGEMLGKSREQVKNKIQHMRKEGKL